MSCFVSERNLLYFGGSNGLVEVVPKDVMHVNKKAPKVVLTDFLVHNQSIDTLSRKNIVPTTGLNLSIIKITYFCFRCIKLYLSGQEPVSLPITRYRQGMEFSRYTKTGDL